jgi:plasmid segregation protein ParM
MEDSVIDVGADDGHDTIKICAGYDKASDSYQCSYVKSKATAGLHHVMTMGQDPATAYRTGQDVFTVTGEQALTLPIDTRALDYPTSPLNRVLVNHAMIKAGLSGKKVRLFTGLPVDQFYKGGQPNTDLISRKAANLMIPVESVRGITPASVARHDVISEGIAAFYDCLVEGDGTFNRQLEDLVVRRPVAVVDAGGKTLNVAVVTEGAAGIYQQRSGSENIGVISLLEQAAQMIKANLGLNNDPPTKYVEEAFVTKQYELFGEMVDVSNIIEECAREYLAKIKNYVIKKTGDGSDLGAMIFVGGGIALLRAALGEGIFAEIYKGRILLPKDPQFANARGMWKAATYIFAATEGEPVNLEAAIPAAATAEIETKPAKVGKKHAATA